MVAATIIEKSKVKEQSANALAVFLQIKTDGVSSWMRLKFKVAVIAPESLACHLDLQLHFACLTVDLRKPQIMRRTFCGCKGALSKCYMLFSLIYSLRRQSYLLYGVLSHHKVKMAATIGAHLEYLAMVESTSGHLDGDH